MNFLATILLAILPFFPLQVEDQVETVFTVGNLEIKLADLQEWLQAVEENPGHPANTIVLKDGTVTSYEMTIIHPDQKLPVYFNREGAEFHDDIIQELKKSGADTRVWLDNMKVEREDGTKVSVSISFKIVE